MSRSRPNRFALGVMLLTSAAGMWLGCGKAALETPPRAAPAIVISGDTGPWIVPCGCTANQSGGLPRRGAYLAGERAHGDVLYLEAGGAAAGTSAYFQEKFQAVLAGEVLMNVAAHNLGRAEIALGPDVLRTSADKTNVPFISANATAAGKPLAPPLRIVTAGGVRVAVVGVVSPKFATDAVRVSDPRRAVLAAISAVRGQYAHLLVLAYLPDEELQALAASLPEAEAVIGGPTGQAQSPQPRGPTLVGAATNKGKFLVRLDLPQPNAAWSGSVVELGTKYPDDSGQATNVAAYLERLRAADFAATDTGLVAAPLNMPADFRVTGSDSCARCHQAEQASWAMSKHAHAHETLIAKKGYQYEPYCLQCHTTGYAMPGGYASPQRTPTLGGVGCESCHGPSAAHVARPAVRTPYAAMDQCVRCHDHENSPAFDRTTYWPKIQHGKSKPATSAKDGPP